MRQRPWRKTFLVGVLLHSVVAVLLPAPASAQATPPPAQGRIVPTKGAGALVGDAFHTRLAKPLKIEVTGVTRRAVVRIYAGDTLIAERLNSPVKAVLTTTPALTEGVYPLSATQTVEGVESARLTFLSLVVDHSAPAAPSAPDLTPESDTGASNSDDMTAMTRLVFTGTGEPGATAQLFATGKPIKNATVLVPQSGAFTLTLPKAKAGAVLYTLVQTDAAGNASIPGAPLQVSVFTKAPKPPSAIALFESDRLAGNPRATGNLNPTIIGAGLPGSVVTLRLNNSEIGTAGVDAGGFWALTLATPLNYGVHLFSATQTDAVGKTSKPGRAGPITVVLDNQGPAPNTDGAVVVDDFNDNSRHVRWKPVEVNDNIVTARETGSRLELRMRRQNGPRVLAGFFADDWRIDMTQDFRVRVNWRMPTGRLNNGEVAIALGLMMDGSTSTGALHDGVLQILGVGPGGAYHGHRSRFDGDNGDAKLNTRSATIGTLYMWYVAADDRLRMSLKGFDDANPNIMFGVRSAGGVNAGAFFLAGWADTATPEVSGSAAHFDNFVIEAGAILPGRVPSDGGVDAPIRADDFENNQRDPIWRELRLNAQFAEAEERNERLEIDFATNPGFVDASGGYFSNGWAVDLTQDFRMRVDARFPAASFATLPGNIGLTFALTLDSNAQTGVVNEGLIFNLGATRNGPYRSWAIRRGGAHIDSGTEARADSLQTIYFRYETATNRLYFSTDGYNDAGARFVPGLRTATKTTAIVFLTGFSINQSPGVGPGNAWFDNFSLDKGVLVATSSSTELNDSTDDASSADEPGALGAATGDPAPDLNNDGAVDAADIAILTAQYNTRGAGLRADLNQDGKVDADDLRILLQSIGM